MKIKSAIISAPAIIYIASTLILLIFHLISSKTNPADSGESAIVYFILTMLPWTQFFDIKFTHIGIYPISMLFGLINACVIFLATSLIFNIFHQPVNWIKHKVT